MSPSCESVRRVTLGLLILHVWVVAAVIPLLDKFLSLERMLRLLTPRRLSGLYRGISADRIAGIVQRRLRRPIHMRRRACLRRSLTLYHFARLAGIDAVFHVAVFPPSVDPRRLHAHSWVTVDGTCLSAPPERQAVEMLRYGAISPDGVPQAAGRKIHGSQDWTNGGPRV